MSEYDLLSTYISCKTAPAENMSNNGIANLRQATSHWRSCAGGVVRAHSLLYEEMKNHPSFSGFISEMEGILRGKIEDTDVDSYIKNAPDSNRSLKCPTMGHYKLNIEYNHKVNIGVNYVNLHLYGEDLWDFEYAFDKSFLDNLKNQILPLMVAGNGRKFSISYDFNYTVKVEPTYYYILSSINMDYCLDIEGASQKNEANVQIYLKNRTDAQKFSFSKCGDYYYIVCKCSGKVIDVKHSGKDPGTNIWQYELNKTHAQQWKIEKGKTWTFYSRVNGLCLDLNSSGTYNGNNIHCWTPNNTNAQKFYVFEINSIFGCLFGV